MRNPEASKRRCCSMKEIDNEQAIMARIRAIEDEIYRINQPAAYAYSLEMSRA